MNEIPFFKSQAALKKAGLMSAQQLAKKHIATSGWRGITHRWAVALLKRHEQSFIVRVDRCFCRVIPVGFKVETRKRGRPRKVIDNA